MSRNPLAEAAQRRLQETGDRYLTRWQIAAYEAILISAVVGSAWFDLWLSETMVQSGSALVGFFRVFEDMGDSKWFLVTASCWMLACLMGLRLAASPDVRLKLRWLVRGQAYLIASVAVSGIISNLFKWLFGRARPAHLDEGLSADWRMFQSDWGMQSYPSGHATTLFAAAFALSVLFPRFRLVFFGLAIAGAIGRVAWGAHFLSDVIAGAALGAFTAWWLKGYLARRDAAVGPYPA
ncbi:MAG: phosphatase PAP2 family protein [Minwuia sp.]|uniref:phosphatase PAP2 family protein n=1 Tax=Minwuia sp. TaxID=2493630 RepID=UPI003A8A40F4